ncbi:MAG: Ig-like domain-containing protein, partial [Treponema sp.]|nr:Ig-like domain-containing protein [Treponema sp.]
GAIITGTSMSLIGFAEDDDGVASLLYSLDGKAPVELPCSGYFQLTVNDIPPGLHNLDIWAKDITGVEGRKVSVKGIIVPGMAPKPRFTQVRSGTGKTAVQAEFYSGMEVNNEAGSSLDLLVSSGSGIQSISYQLGSRDPIVISVKGSKGGDMVQSIPIPKEMDLGLLRLGIKVTDIYNQETALEDYVYITNSGGQRGNSAPDFTWVQPDNSLGDGRILLSTSDPLVGIYSGGPLQSVEVSGTSSATFDNSVDEYGRLKLLASVDGNYSLKFTLTARDGTKFTTPEYKFLVAGSAPELDIVENPDGKWLQNMVQVKFRVGDSNKIKTVDFSIDLGASWHPLLQPAEIAKLTPQTIIDKTLDISALADGAINVNIRVTDEANKQTIQSFQVNKDTTAPEAKLIVPIAGAKVNGTIRLGIAIKEGGKLASVSYENPGSKTGGQVVPPISKQLYPDPARGNTPFTFLDVVLDSKEMPLAENMSFVFTDAAGNKFTLSQWPFIIDQEMDLPVAQISLPLEGEVITTDFVISGICYDDDQVKQIHWSMDGKDEKVVEAKNSFSIEVPLSSMTDNEHTVTVYAEDIFGVKGKPVTRNFKVSLEEPKASVTIPKLGEIVGGTVQIAGVAMDNNGIKRVQVSLDNGNTFNNAEGTTRWTYTFNSKILQDGPSVVFIRVWDNYDITALYSSMLIVDNTEPELVVDTPKDGAETTGPVYITGQAVDNVMLESITIKLSSLEGVKIPPGLVEKKAKLDSVLLEELDLSALPDGAYNVEVWANDKAKNVSRVSRNIKLSKDKARDFVDNLYPLNGEHVQGYFNLYGYVGGIDTASQVTLMVNGLDVKTEAVTDAGYYCFALGPNDLHEGTNKIVVRGDFTGNQMVQSAPRTIEYKASGPWVTVDTMSMGDFAFHRPWLFGRAGYELSADDQAVLADKKADKDLKTDVAAKKVNIIELSLDNGRTFFAASKARGTEYDWRYRLETQDMAEGLHYILARATMVNGDTAVTRLLVQVDKTPPVIRLISPEAGGRYNTSLEFSAL